MLIEHTRITSSASLFRITPAALVIPRGAKIETGNSMAELDTLRTKIRQRYLQTEPQIVEELLAEQKLNEDERTELTETAADMVAKLRANTNPTVMESFLSEYGLSTKEGVGLMCLAEALLRVPDAATVDELIADKIEPSNWGLHLGQSSSSSWRACG